MDFRILGPVEVIEEGRSLPLGGAKPRALIALLLLRPNEVVAAERLVDELWAEQPPPTAAKTIQVYVSKLRKILGQGVLLSQAPGYMLRVEPGTLDLHRFESLVSEAAGAAPTAAAEKLREALGLWRGPPLADFAYEPFAQAEIARLEELRLAALEERVEADLALGRHAQLIPELEAVVAQQPLRERPRGQLMVALYRADRQAEALQAYQETRKLLDEELGLEPSEALQRLEKAILVHDPALELAQQAGRAPEPEAEAAGRSIVLVSRDERDLTALLALAEPLAAAEPPRELILARLVAPQQQERIAEAAAELAKRRAQLLARRLAARVAAFTSPQPDVDIVRLASTQNADLLMLAASLASLDRLGGDIGAVLDGAQCDVALLVDRQSPGPSLAAGKPVLVPFGAAQHDWAALELGAWLARALGAPLRLVGSTEASGDGRDASRLLADASLLVQRCAGIGAEPVLTRPGPDGVLSAAGAAGLLIIGLSERWHQEGLGPARSAIAEAAPVPVIFVRRGPRPGGLAPRETLTRFTWSLSASRS
jgi:DNA-binding SARP family transcriptional activator